MPYKSEAQRKFFNSEAGKEKLGEAEVEHWNKESEGMKLPEKVKDTLDKAIKACDVLYEEVESSGPYMLVKGASNIWAVFKNGAAIKYGDESKMREFYKKVLKANGYAMDKAIKVCDVNKYVEKAKELIKNKKGRLEIISELREMGLTPSDVSKYYGQAKNELGMYDSSSVKDSLDKAVRVCDKSEFETIKQFLNSYLRYSTSKINEAEEFEKDKDKKWKEYSKIKNEFEDVSSELRKKQIDLGRGRADKFEVKKLEDLYDKKRKEYSKAKSDYDSYVSDVKKKRLETERYLRNNDENFNDWVRTFERSKNNFSQSEIRELESIISKYKNVRDW